MKVNYEGHQFLPMKFSSHSGTIKALGYFTKTSGRNPFLNIVTIRSLPDIEELWT